MKSDISKKFFGEFGRDRGDSLRELLDCQCAGRAQATCNEAERFGEGKVIGKANMLSPEVHEAGKEKNQERKHWAFCWPFDDAKGGRFLVRHTSHRGSFPLTNGTL